MTKYFLYDRDTLCREQPWGPDVPSMEVYGPKWGWRPTDIGAILNNSSPLTEDRARELFPTAFAAPSVLETAQQVADVARIPVAK